MAKAGRLVGLLTLAVVVVVSVVVGIAWFVSRAPDHPKPLAARHPDLFGQAQLEVGHDYSWDGHLPGTIGPMTVRIGDHTVPVPPRTPLYGDACGDFFRLGTEQPPCFPQVGLRRDGNAAWLAGFYLAPGTSTSESLPTRSATVVQTITPTEVVLFDGVTVPLASNTTVDCRDRKGLADLAGALVTVSVDRSDGHAVKLECVYRM